MSLGGELVSAPGGIETGLGPQRTWNPVTIPFKNVPQAQGQVTQGTLSGTGAWAWHEHPLTYTPFLPPPCLPKFRGSALALSVAPRLPALRATMPPLPQVLHPLLGPWVPWAGQVGEGSEEEPTGLLVDTSGLPDMARWRCAVWVSSLGCGHWRTPLPRSSKTGVSSWLSHGLTGCPWAKALLEFSYQQKGNSESTEFHRLYWMK